MEWCSGTWYAGNRSGCRNVGGTVFLRTALGVANQGDLSGKGIGKIWLRGWVDDRVIMT